MMIRGSGLLFWATLYLLYSVYLCLSYVYFIGHAA